MNKKILILGASGNFGSKIATLLAQANIEIVLAGRSENLLSALKVELKHNYPNAVIDIACFDIHEDLSKNLKRIHPFIAINTCGPFQSSDYSLAIQCANFGIHYIDLADGRDFVNGINELSSLAQSKQCLIISGASTVPGLSSAVLEHYKQQFSEITALQYGIAPAQQADRGLATTQGILSYVGKPLKPIPGQSKIVYGWQDIYLQHYPELGKRWMANCDIPDLDLFPKMYGIQHIQFSAGLESSVLHVTLWMLSCLTKLN